MPRIDYGPGDRIICVARFDPNKMSSVREGREPMIPEVGEVYTCTSLVEHPDDATHLGTTLAESERPYYYLATFFRKVPKIPPRRTECRSAIERLKEFVR